MRKVVFVGNVNVGKTSLIAALKDGARRRDMSPTIGLRCDTVWLTMLGGECFEVLFWDTSGDEKFRQHALHAIRDASVVVVCFDISMRDSFDAVPGWTQAVPMRWVLVGCKSDLENQRQVDVDLAQAQVERLDGRDFVETSSVTGAGLAELLGMLGSALQEPPLPPQRGGVLGTGLLPGDDRPPRRCCLCCS